MITTETRKNNLILLKALEETNVDLVEKLISSEEFNNMNQLEVSFLIQDSLMKTFVGKDDNEPLRLSNNTIRLLMLHKLNKMI